MKYLMAALLWWPLSIISDPVDLDVHPRSNEFDRLILTESSGNVNALSKVGAIGLGQITTNCLNHFNWSTGSKVRPAELYNSETNKMITQWYLEWLENYFDKYPEPDRSVLMFSSYNMGAQRTLFDTNLDFVLVYRPYVKKITPIRYMQFRLKNKLIWKGKRIDLWRIR